MTDKTIECCVIPSTPVPLVLPKESIAEVINTPTIEVLEDARAGWMKGYVNWQNQRLQVMSYAALQDPNIKETTQNSTVIVLNPIPGAARKAYCALICSGDTETISVDESCVAVPTPKGLDKRYIESTMEFKGMTYVVPRLSAISVAFSYF